MSCRKRKPRYAVCRLRCWKGWKANPVFYGSIAQWISAGAALMIMGVATFGVFWFSKAYQVQVLAEEKAELTLQRRALEKSKRDLDRALTCVLIASEIREHLNRRYAVSNEELFSSLHRGQMASLPPVTSDSVFQVASTSWQLNRLEREEKAKVIEALKTGKVALDRQLKVEAEYCGERHPDPNDPELASCKAMLRELGGGSGMPLPLAGADISMEHACLGEGVVVPLRQSP